MSHPSVAFVLTAHAADDDRVLYHQSAALAECGIRNHIFAFRTNHKTIENATVLDVRGTTRKARFQMTCAALKQFGPDVLIGDTPAALRICQLYKKKTNRSCKIIYDITEWYPSKKNLKNLTFLSKLLKFSILAAANFAMSLKSDGFIFGEYYKAKPYRFLFPRKKSVDLPYYPDKKYIRTETPNDIDKKIRLFYSGPSTLEKGYHNILDVAEKLAIKHKDIPVELNIVTDDTSMKVDNTPANLIINSNTWLPFEEFCSKAASNDIFLDLRSIDTENHRCLPIKLFYYMAMGKPVIYSNLKAIRNGCPEIDSFGHLVIPENTAAVADIISKYICNPELYLSHCQAARALFEKKYNWQNIKSDFVTFVDSLWA